MDFLIECGTAIAEKIAEYTVAPVGRQLGYIFHYGRNVDNLRTEIKDLKLEKKKMEVLVDEAKRKGDEIHDDVKVWLSDVDDKITELEEKCFGAEDTTEMKCTFKGSISCLASRYKLGKKAKEMGESVVKLKSRINFDHIAFRPKRQNHFENKDYLRSVTREKFVNEIMEELGDANIRTIGLHGMPGVGKTTLVKEIARKASKEDPKLFDDAVIVTVSQTPDLEKIQQHIADRLDLEFKKKMISERALEIRDRLKNENKFLIVLDDVWNELKLQDVGIVFESHQKGCKILFTSRFERVLGVDMGVDKNFKVELLLEDEASNWFNDIVGVVAKTHEFKEIGSKIVKKCGCLPLAIVTVANCLKNRLLPIWRDAWTRLENCEQNEIVSSAIKLCYDSLESNETKILVSLCSLHEEDANIKMEYLMRYCWGMGMFRGNMTFQTARDRMHGWVDALKDRCLLLDGYDSGTVKMHDVVRDITISIAKESHNMHCFRGDGEVEDFLKQKKFEDLKAISLPNGYLDELLFKRSEYTQLQLMICMRSRSSKIIPGDFLDRIKPLKVLKFSQQDYLPSHLSSLQNLRTLCLRKSDVDDIAEIGNLKNLEILDLSGSSIKKLPSEIGELTRLRMLDLSGCRYLEVIEPNVILHLKRLEELYVDGFKNWHKVDEVDNNGERRNAGLDELKELDHLTALHLTVPDIVMLQEGLLCPNLERFYIKIGGYNQFYNVAETLSRHLLVGPTESSLLREHGLETFVKRSEVLWLLGLNDVNDIVNELDTKGFPELKSLTLENNHTIQYLVNYSMAQIHPCTAFCRLETLWLVNLSNLKQICHGEDTVELFKTLRVVKVGNCRSLKKLLPLFNARQIEEIEISNCNAMEEIFTHQIQDDGDDNDQVIVELRSLKLENVSKLGEFCSLKKICSTSQKEEEPFVGDSNIMPLFNGKFLCFPKLKKLELDGCDAAKKLWDDQLVPSSTSFCFLTKLEVWNCKCLKYVFSSSIAASFKQLHSLKVRGCEAMEEIVSRNERTDNISFPSFPKLRSLLLIDLPKLSTFSSGVFVDFSLLNFLNISNCPEWKTFVAESTEDKSNTTMPSIFNENVAFPSLKRLRIRQMEKMIWQHELCNINANSFCKLEEVEVEECKNLRGIFPSGMYTRLRNLRKLEIRDCQKVEGIFVMETSNCTGIEEVVGKQEGLETVLPRDHDDEFVLPQLQELSLGSLPNLMSIYAGTHTPRFPLLKVLTVQGCHKMQHLLSSQAAKSMAHLNSLKMISCINLEVSDCKCLKYVFSSSMAASFKQLDHLKVSGCEAVEEIVSRDERMDNISFPKLCSLWLRDLPKLSTFSSGIFIEFSLLNDLNISNCPELKTFVSESLEDNSNTTMPSFFNKNFLCFPKLKELTLDDCHATEKLWDDQLVPSSTSFCFLTRLVVSNCKCLKYVFSSSMAASFKQLYYLKVKGCEAMEEIVSRDERMDNISFPKLYSLMLLDLPKLSTFSSGIFIEFSLLNDLNVSNCPELKTFVSESSEDKSNTTMPSFFNKNVAFPSLKRLGIRQMDGLKMIWQRGICNINADSFCKLEKVAVECCKNLMGIVPSGMHTRLRNLRELEIRNCQKVEEIFVMETSNCSGIEEVVGKLEGLETVLPRDHDDEFVFPQLQKMHLTNLPNLVTIYAGTHTLRFPLLKKN